MSEKCLTIPKVVENIEQQEVSHSADGSVNWYI